MIAYQEPTCEVIEVVRKTTYAFDGRLTTTQEVVLATGVELADWRTATLEVIAHERNTWPSPVTLSVRAFAVSLNPVSPKVEYLGPQLAAILVRDTDPIPALSTASLTPMPSHARVVLRWQQGAAGAGQQTVAVTVRIVGRSR